jgi:antagonist of KipI
MEQFLAEEYAVDANSNRMGLRLAGKPLPRPEGEQLSAPVCPGTVQITHDGQPIVLGVDAQTIGGYARIAHVIAADLDKLAQLAPGERLRFAKIELAEAVRLWRQREGWLREWSTRLRNAWF